MNTAPAVEMVTVPMHNGWRVRISDGRKLQFVSGFDAKRDADEWIRNSSQTWLAKLNTAFERL